MARSQVATDDFNRANGGLGSNWSQLITSSTVQISGNEITGSHAGTSAIARWNGAGSFADDQYSSLVLADGDQGSGDYGNGVVVRASADQDAGVDCYYVYVANGTVFGKLVDGADTNFASSGVPTWTAGDRLELECEGTTVRVMKNGVALGGSFTVTDASLSTGKPGVLGRGDPGIQAADDWEGGSLVAADTGFRPMFRGA